MQQAPGRAGDRLAADDHRGRIAQEPAPQALAEPGGGIALVRPGQLPWREVEQGDDERQTGRERHDAADGVVDRTSGARGIGPPGRPEARAAQDERVDGHRRRAQQVGRRQESPPDDLERSERGGRVVDVRAQRSAKDSPGRGSASKAAEQAVEVGGGQRRALGLLERAGVEDDSDAGRAWRRGGSHQAAGAVGEVRAVVGGRGRRGRQGRTDPAEPPSRSFRPGSGCRRRAPPELLGPKLDDDDERLHDDPPAHLRLADPAVAERDRRLADPGAEARRPERHLDLEDVAAGMDPVERDPGQGASPARP